MQTIEKEKNIHQGKNIKLVRQWKGITQEGLAYDLKMSQKQISEIETRKKIEQGLMDKIASVLNVPADFLKTFEMDDIVNTYNMYESKIEVTSAENSYDSILQQGEQNITNYNYPIDDIKELYNKLLEEKDKQIARFEKQVADLQKQVDDLKNKK